MSCLFESLIQASGMSKDYPQSLLLRLDLVQFVMQHKDTYEKDVFYLYSETIDQYCRRMSMPHEQGDYIMVCAFVHMFNRELRLKIMPSGAVHIIKSNPDSLFPPVTICWQPGHYFV